MSNEHNTDRNRQPGQQEQQDKSDSKRQPGQQVQQDKSCKGNDTKSDRANQEKEGKGKIATSSPGGSKSDSKRL